MALELNFSVCQAGDCESVIFIELTGGYNELSNPRGWGNPNVAIADYHYAKVEFFLNGTGSAVHTATFDDELFPTTDTEFEYEIPVTLADGWYSIVYTVQTAEGVTAEQYTKTIYQSFYCNVRCCVMSMLDGIDVECDCSHDAIEAFNKAYVLLKGLQYASGCGNLTNFNNILAQLQKLCLNSNCQNCN